MSELAEPRLALTIGPVMYYWSRQDLGTFYEQIAESPADSVVLGEVVCSRRHEMKPSDWISLAQALAQAGKEVILATQILMESEAELRTMQRLVEQDEFLVEAGDASALNWLQQRQLPFVLGPHINVYNAPALQEYRRMGAVRWVAPVELSLDAIAKVHADEAGMPTEVFAFGRMPLAFSARCFTARHHHLSKDRCEFICRQDPDGLLLSTSDQQPFLALNGIQIQSAAQQCLLGEAEAIRAAGISRVRLSPSSRQFAEIVQAFDDVMNHGAPAQAALEGLQPGSLAGGFVNGYANSQAGLVWEA